MLRKRELFVEKYGPVLGPKLFHALQSQAAHAGVSARLRRKLGVLTGRRPSPARVEAPLPLFPEADGLEAEPAGEALAVG